MTCPHGGREMNIIKVEDQALVFVVRKDGMPGLYMQPGIVNGHACALFAMMIQRLILEGNVETGGKVDVK